MLLIDCWSDVNADVEGRGHSKVLYPQVYAASYLRLWSLLTDCSGTERELSYAYHRAINSDPRTLNFNQILASKSISSLRGLRGFLHLLPLIVSDEGIGQDNPEGSKLNPEFPSPNKLLYALASVSGRLLLGLG